MIKVDRGNLSHLDGLLLSDTEFHQPRPIDMLLGADVWGMVVREGIVKGGPHKPCALATCFGWVVVGPTSANGVWDGSVRANIVTCPEEDSLELLLKRFWSLEEPELTREQGDISEEIFMSTVFRDVCGRYGVQIPFRPDAPAIGDSYKLAET